MIKVPNHTQASLTLAGYRFKKILNFQAYYWQIIFFQLDVHIL